jgi:protease I
MRIKNLLLLIALVLLITSCTTTAPTEPANIQPPVMSAVNQTNTTNRILMIIAQQDFQDQELLIPRRIFQENNFAVDIASLDTSLAKGTGGTKIYPDLAVKNAKVADYDAIVVVGGAGSPKLAENKEVLELLQDANEQGKVVAGICFGPISLAESGILRGKRATVYAQGTTYGVDILAKDSVIYVNKELIVDGNIVTANGPAAAETFGNKIVELLG